jgi:signal transduction histidine kinase
MFRTIRQGLFAALAGFTVLICVCYTALAVVIAYVTEDMVVDRLLEREAVAAATYFRQHGKVGPAANELIRAYRSFDALPDAVRQSSTPAARRAEVFTRTGQHYHLRRLDVAGGVRLYLLADAAPLLVVSQLVNDVGGVLIGVALALLGLALLLAYLLARRLVLPLQVLAQEARGVKLDSAIDFSGRARPDEIGFLAQRLASSFGQLQDALRREHAFTRDVSHELRTPLTVMNNTLALAGSRPLDVAQLQAGLDEVRATIEVLFALARAEHIPAEALDLRMCVEQCMLRLLQDGRWEDREVAIELRDRLPVHGNPQLAALLINNCLSNALFHGGAGSQLRVAFADGCLSISNTVAGEARMQGFAHGQNLLVRVAGAMGWQVSFHPGDAVYRVDIVPS